MLIFGPNIFGSSKRIESKKYWLRNRCIFRMKDFCIEQNNDVENIALIGERLGAAGVNIEGLCVIRCEQTSIVHFVVEDELTARNALESSKIKIKNVSDVFVFSKDEKQVTGKPGSFGEICRALTDHGVNIDFGYPAENNRFVFGVSDITKARELLA